MDQLPISDFWISFSLGRWRLWNGGWRKTHKYSCPGWYLYSQPCEPRPHASILKTWS